MTKLMATNLMHFTHRYIFARRMRACVQWIGSIETAAQEIILDFLLDVVRGKVPTFFGKLLLLIRVDGQTRRGNGELN